MGSTTNCYAGVLDLGENPDWKKVAASIDLLRADGVKIVPKRGVLADDRVLLPFCAAKKVRSILSHEPGDPRLAIEEVMPYELSRYAKLDPKTANAGILNTMARLCSDSDDETPTDPADLLPKDALATDAAEAFDGLVGLSAQREELLKVANLVSKHGRDTLECAHLAFIGAPGTGKTELARRLLAYYDATGVTDGSGNFVKASASDLVSHYVGNTPSKTRAVVERALGGLLFIDEAYSLASVASYGEEAIDTLVEMLDCHRNDLVCVVAGYPHEMEDFFARNSGLRERFSMHIRFDDYSVDELCEIFLLFADKHGFRLDRDARIELGALARKMRSEENFANARSMRRLFDRAAMEAAWRADEKLITRDDLLAAWSDPNMGRRSAKKVGFRP